MLNVVKSPYRTAYENLAFEQELLRTGTPFLFTHRDAPCVSVGFNQDIEAEVDAALAKELGVDIVRRQSGGGAVYRDEGCVAFSMAVPQYFLLPGASRRSIASRSTSNNTLPWNTTRSPASCHAHPHTLRPAT